MATRKARQFFSRPMLVYGQISAMKEKFPWFIAKRGRAFIEWTGKVRPSTSSPEYTLSVKFFFNWGFSHRKRNHAVEVRVLSPSLPLFPGKKKLPHVYSGNRLCLFYPKYREWSSESLIANTIMDWAIFWLAHYEIWASTGIWTADEVTHVPGDKKRKRFQLIRERPAFTSRA